MTIQERGAMTGKAGVTRVSSSCVQARPVRSPRDPAARLSADVVIVPKALTRC
jgi:hypothetical protein